MRRSTRRFTAQRKLARRLRVERLEDRRQLAGDTGLALTSDVGISMGPTEVVYEPTAISAPIANDQAATPHVSVEPYLLNEWSGGASVSVIVRNLGSNEIEGWSVRWLPADGEQISYTWDAHFDVSDAGIFVTPSEANNVIPAGEAVAFGFNVKTNGDAWCTPAFEFIAEPHSPSDAPVDDGPNQPGGTSTDAEDGSNDNSDNTSDPVDGMEDLSVVNSEVEARLVIALSWEGGSTANVVIRNPTLQSMSIVDVSWDWPADYGIDLSWNASVIRTESGAFTAVFVDDLKTVAPGEAVSFGFNVSHSGELPSSTAFTVRVLQPASQPGGTDPTSADEPAVDPPVTENNGRAAPRNFFVGTQSIGPGYSLTDDDRLVETAKTIRAMGSNILKIALDPTLYDMPGLYQWEPTLLLQTNPSFQAVLEMDFDYYFFWLERSGSWADNLGVSAEEYAAEYQVTYELASYLLEAHADSGKTFLIGNWETDWNLLEWNPTTMDVEDVRIQGLIDWINLRQDAIDQAKQDFAGSGVDLYHYIEVNRVDDAQELGYERVVNAVLPATNVDFVSYSAYDVLLDDTNIGSYDEALGDNLSYIESLLPEKDELPFERRVFVGEFGFYLEYVTPQQQVALTNEVLQAAISWGTPFVLNWQLYDTSANERIYLVSGEGTTTLVYELLVNYQLEMESWADVFVLQHAREPTEAEIRSEALVVLASLA